MSLSAVRATIKKVLRVWGEVPPAYIHVTVNLRLREPVLGFYNFYDGTLDMVVSGKDPPLDRLTAVLIHELGHREQDLEKVDNEMEPWELEVNAWERGWWLAEKLGILLTYKWMIANEAAYQKTQPGKYIKDLIKGYDMTKSEATDQVCKLIEGLVGLLKAKE